MLAVDAAGVSMTEVSFLPPPISFTVAAPCDTNGIQPGCTGGAASRAGASTLPAPDAPGPGTISSTPRASALSMRGARAPTAASRLLCPHARA